uniref:Exosome complex component RRP46 n=1 Tax=Chrysemys picta bellii TaxID=8478 RepID=A0A8C3HAE5_CHRPI
RWEVCALASYRQMPGPPSLLPPGVFEKNREQLIRKTCEAVILGALHPRTSISIVLQVISDAGAVSFTGSPAGGALQCIMVHGLSPRSGVARQFTVPLPWQEARAVLTFAISSVEQQVLMSTSKGTCSVEELQRCIAAAQRASGAIFQFYRDSVRRKYSKA